MTFDEMIEKLLNNEDYNTDGLSVDDVITLIEVLRLEYAPTVEMTQRAYKYLKEEHDKFIKTGNDNFLSNNGLGNWRFNDEHRIDIESGEAYIDEFTAEHNHFKGLTRTEVIQTWLHPETIKIVDKEED